MIVDFGPEDTPAERKKTRTPLATAKTVPLTPAAATGSGPVTLDGWLAGNAVEELDAELALSDVMPEMPEMPEMIDTPAAGHPRLELAALPALDRSHSHEGIEAPLPAPPVSPEILASIQQRPVRAPVVAAVVAPAPAVKPIAAAPAAVVVSAAPAVPLFEDDEPAAHLAPVPAASAPILAPEPNLPVDGPAAVAAPAVARPAPKAQRQPTSPLAPAYAASPVALSRDGGAAKRDLIHSLSLDFQANTDPLEQISAAPGEVVQLHSDAGVYTMWVFIALFVAAGLAFGSWAVFLYQPQ